MKDERNVRLSARSRFNRARRIVEAMLRTLNKDAANVGDAEMASLRQQAAELGQCVHEFNAYRNTLEWNDKEQGR